MHVRVRFAPSPTGHVHIGNIRVAIFNWLFARNQNGTFLLRIEDTDRERSTPEAVATLLDALAWLGLDVDESPLYQSTRSAAHGRAAEGMLSAGAAYRHAKGGGAEATIFRIPQDTDGIPEVRVVGAAEIDVHPGEPVVISRAGVDFSQRTRKGKAAPQSACLAGFRDLQVLDTDGRVIFALNEHLDRIVDDNQTVRLQAAARFRFTRREVAFDDVVKGHLGKPLDSMRDFVIVRSDGSPVFHLANVCDDLAQRVTHVIRGEDHVENTYRQLFIYRALGATPPTYAHLPMIVNAAGKPYSKRDGDAFVGDFRRRGYLADALFNDLALLGWSPGDGREKLTRAELIASFSLHRVQQAAAQMDLRKCAHLNGQYLAELPFETFLARCRETARDMPWDVNGDYFATVAKLMQSRTKLFTDVAGWAYFFCAMPTFDAKAYRKFIDRPECRAAIAALIPRLEDTDPDDLPAVEALFRRTEQEAGLAANKLNQTVRVALTGGTVGAGIYETLAVLGKERALARLRHALTDASH